MNTKIGEKNSCQEDEYFPNDSRGIETITTSFTMKVRRSGPFFEHEMYTRQ
jgi:hypothetical protein